MGDGKHSMIILLLNNFIESQILIVFSFALRFSFSAIIERFGASFVTELGADIPNQHFFIPPPA